MSNTSQGTKYAICASLPATDDYAGYNALAFTTVKGVESIPAFGAMSKVNSFQPLDGPEEKHKGPVNYGSLQIPAAYEKADPGQAILVTAADPTNNNMYAHRVTYPNGDIRFFSGRVFGMPETPGSATNVRMLNATVEISTKVVPYNP
ncbi:hypothetical protein O4H52_07885 [Sphingomonadaceae bacterium G21617-S1]|nr:hypothetical protein [Sphingomonadaceae bacterium G21617-S1]